MLTAGERVGSVTEAWSIDLPVVTAVGPRANVPGTGSVSMMVIGAGFGMGSFSPMARVGLNACEASAWESETSVRAGATACESTEWESDSSGSNFGLTTYTEKAREGDTACEASEWESETSVRCVTGQGVKRTSTVAVTVGETSGSVTEAWSVDAGSASVTVHGSSFGLTTYTEAI
ncbi:hypothetical protein T484DRAFT_1873922, partial [Baffinella frigidus]